MIKSRARQTVARICHLPSVRIVKLLAQLFFRHNQQEHQKGLSSPSKKKQAVRHERQRSQTLGQRYCELLLSTLKLTVYCQ